MITVEIEFKRNCQAVSVHLVHGPHIMHCRYSDILYIISAEVSCVGHNTNDTLTTN